MLAYNSAQSEYTLEIKGSSRRKRKSKFKWNEHEYTVSEDKDTLKSEVSQTEHSAVFRSSQSTRSKIISPTES